MSAGGLNARAMRADCRRRAARERALSFFGWCVAVGLVTGLLVGIGA